MPEVELVTVPNVEIVTTGDWDASTGPVTFTEDDLRAAVAALDDPAVKSPRLKLGHLDPRFTPDGDKSIFDGTPALGKFVNLRLADGGQSIVADIAGVPKWLADIMPTAYPNRSIEGYWNVKTATGKEHKFVITAVSLLGVVGPAVETLEDLPVLFSADGPDGVEIVDGERVAATRGGPMPQPQRVAASVQYEDVRRAFYQTFAVDDRYWWWIHAVYVDPPVLIVDDDEGHLWRVPYSVSGEDVEFGDPVEVRIQYVETESGNVAARQGPAKVYATKAESRPEPTTEEDSMDPKLIRERLGLAEDASDEEVLSRLDELKAGTPSAEEQPPAEPAPESAEEDEPEEQSGREVPEGMILIDEETLLQLQEQAAEGVAARRQQVEERRKGILDDAIKAGKIPPARREHYAKLLEKDEEGTVALLSSLAPGLVPVDERGSAGKEGQESKDAYPEEWFPEVAARREAGSNGYRKVSIVKEV